MGPLQGKRTLLGGPENESSETLADGAQNPPSPQSTI